MGGSRTTDLDGHGAYITEVSTASMLRRLTVRECERLMAFPDDYTRISWRGKPPEDCPDGPRYRTLGNSMAVNVMQWLGERIALCESIGEEPK